MSAVPVVVIDGLTRSMLEVLRRMFEGDGHIYFWGGGYWSDRKKKPGNKPQPGWSVGPIILKSLADKGYIEKIEKDDPQMYALTAAVSVVKRLPDVEANKLKVVIARESSAPPAPELHALCAVTDEALHEWFVHGSAKFKEVIAESASLPHLRAWAASYRMEIKAL